MNEIEVSINRIFGDIPQSKRKEEIKQEIIQNLNEKVSDLVANGQSAEEAVKKALDDFGDIDDLKEELESCARSSRAGRTGLALAFSVWGAVITAAFFVFINLYCTPGVIWFVYPVFAVLWWPLTMFFHWRRLKYDKPSGFGYSVCGFALILGLFLFINFYCTPDVIWFVYPVFGAFWWPLAMLFHSLRLKSRKEDEIGG